jgi:hypothetical protein
MVIISNPATAGFNSYVGLDEAGSILGNRLNKPNWATAGETQQKRSILVATSTLDEYVDWKGYVTVLTQELSWPRKQVQRRDRGAGVYWDSAIIPDWLKLATAELAEDLLGSDLLADQETGLSALSVGPISLTFDQTDRKNPIPDMIARIVSHYGDVQRVSGDRQMKVYRA